MSETMGGCPISEVPGVVLQNLRLYKHALTRALTSNDPMHDLALAENSLGHDIVDPWDQLLFKDLRLELEREVWAGK
jgi:hypothetical protein